MIQPVQTANARAARQRLFAFGWLISTLLLTGCGFQLREEQQLDDRLRTLYLASERNSDTLRAVRSQLERNGVRLLEQPGPEGLYLQIISEQQGRRAATLNSRAKTEEYELRSQLVFQVMQSDKTPVLAPVTLIAERVYGFDENRVNAKEVEERQLMQEMRQDLARQLVRRYLALPRVLAQIQHLPGPPSTAPAVAAPPAN